MASNRYFERLQQPAASCTQLPGTSSLNDAAMLMPPAAPPPPERGSYRELGTSTGPSRPPPATTSPPPNFSSMPGLRPGFVSRRRRLLLLRRGASSSSAEQGQAKPAGRQAGLGPQRNRKGPAKGCAKSHVLSRRRNRSSQLGRGRLRTGKEGAREGFSRPPPPSPKRILLRRSATYRPRSGAVEAACSGLQMV